MRFVGRLLKVNGEGYQDKDERNNMGKYMGPWLFKDLNY